MTTLKPGQVLTGDPVAVAKFKAGDIVRLTKQGVTIKIGSDPQNVSLRGDVFRYYGRTGAPTFEGAAFGAYEDEIVLLSRTISTKPQGEDQGSNRKGDLPTEGPQAAVVADLIAALKVERDWHDARAGFAFDEARECSFRKEASAERAAMAAYNLHSRRVEVIAAAIAKGGAA